MKIIHGFFFDSQMYANGERPREGDYPDQILWQAFVHSTAEAALQVQKDQKDRLKLINKNMVKQLNSVVWKSLLGEKGHNKALEQTRGSTPQLKQHNVNNALEQQRK